MVIAITRLRAARRATACLGPARARAALPADRARRALLGGDLIPARRRRVRRLRGSLLLATLGACAGPDVERLRALDDAAALRLVGVWDVRFHLDRPLMLAAPTKQRDVAGTIALIEDRADGVSYASLPAALHKGTYDVDFSPLGFTTRAGSSVPEAVGRTAGDSVDIVLAPGAGRLSVALHGRFGGDSVTGTWTVTSRQVGGGGRFVMQRRSNPTGEGASHAPP